MADGRRRAPGEGYSERSKIARKISVAFDNDTFAALVGAARAEGISTAAVVRRIVAASMLQVCRRTIEEREMADVPQRVFRADWIGNHYCEGVNIWSGPSSTYILATPEALAAQPEVQALIRAAKAEGMREAAGILDDRANVARLANWPTEEQKYRIMAFAIRTAVEKLERGE